MAISYVSGSEKAITGTSLAITKPATVAATNVLVAFVENSSSSDTVPSVPSGWTTVYHQETPLTNIAGCYYKVATASEPSSYTWAWSNTSKVSGVILNFSGGTPSAPVDVHAVKKGSGTSVSWTRPTTSYSTEMVVLGAASFTGGTFSTPSGTTAREAAHTTTNSIATFSALQATAGEITAYTSTQSKSSIYSAGVVCLKSKVTFGSATFVGSGTFAPKGSVLASATFSSSGTFKATGHEYFTPSRTGMPLISVQLALTGTCWTGSNWVTIGPLVKQFSTTRGRQHQLQRVEPGQCTLTLSNRDGRFNPWSHNTPYYNQLPATDSNPTTGEGTWAATGGTLARTTTPVRYGSYAWSLTATAAGTMSAVTDSGTACMPKRTYVAVVYARAAATARAVKVAIVWKKSTGTIISTVTGTARDDATGTWGTTPWTVRAVAPTTAAKKEVKVTFSSVADDEVHYVACAGIFDVTYTSGLAAVGQGWCVGQESPLWPGQPIKVTATWHGVEYPIFTGIMKSWVPKYGMVAGDIVVTANDTMHLMANNPVPTSGYSAIVTLSDPTLFWALSTSKVLDSSGNGHTGTASTTFLTFNGTPLVTGTTSESAAFHLEHGHTETGTITVSLTQPEAWSVEMVLEFSATNDQPTLDSTDMLVNVFSWGSGATRIRLVVIQAKAGVNHLFVGKGTTFSTSYLEVNIGSSAVHVVVTHASTGRTQLFVNDVNTATHSLTPSTYAPTFQLGGQSSTYLTGRLYVQDVSIYDHVLSDTEIKTHYTAFDKGFSNQLSGLLIKTLLKATGVPKSTLGTMATGTILCKPPLVTKGETQLLSVLQTTDNTEQGLLFCGATGKVKFLSRAQVGATGTPRATIADDNTGGHYHPFVSPVPSRDDTTLFNYIAVGVQGTTATNPTAITPDLVKIASTATKAAKYGRRMLTGYTGMYFKNVATAQTLANLLLPRLATPVTRVRAVQLSSVSGAGENLPIMLGFELLTLVEVWWQPLDGSDTPFIQTAGIEQIKHTVTKTKWVTTWVLAIPIP